MRLPEEMNAWLWYLGGNVVAERLFWASLEMAVLALAVGMVIALARPASPRVRALLWLLVLAKPLAALALGPLYPVLIVEEPQVAYLTVDPAPWDDGNRQLLTAPAAPPRPAPAAMQADTVARPWGEAWADAARRADPRRAGAALWGLLAGLMALHRALDAVRLRRLVRRGAAPSAACAALYAEAARGLGVRRPPRLVVTDEVESPALAGTLRPVVLLPAWLHTAGEPGVVSWALRHELMHWKLGDTLSNLVRQAARALFFFHPATWWAAARWEEEAELACDRALVSTPGEADAYAGTLYEVLAQMRGRRDRAFAGTLCATRTQIGKRIAALLANPLRCPARPGMWAVAGMLLLAAVALGTGGTFGGQVSADTPPETEEEGLKEALDRRVRLSYDNEHLADVLKRESKKHGVNFALDWRVIAPPPHPTRPAVMGDAAAYATDGMVAAVDCQDLSLREALTKDILAPLGLSYEIVEGVVWVSTPEQLRRDAADGSARNTMPAPGAFPEWDKALNAPTTIEFEVIHIQQVVEFIADSYDLPLVLDSQAVPPPSEDQSTWLYGPVGPDGIRGGAPPFEGDIPPAGTWQPRVFFNDVPARTALSCMLRPLNLVCVPKDGQLLVTARGAQAPAGKGTFPALVRIRTLGSGVKRALIRDRNGGLHWYNEGARLGDLTVTEINAAAKTARLVADDGRWIHMVAETRDGAPEPAWTGPYVALRWEARDGGGEEVSWARGHGEGSLRLEPEALLTEVDVLRAAIKPSEDGRSQDVLLALRPASATSFGAATEAGVGRRLAIVFDGEIMLAPVVRSRITENVMITGLTVSEAQGVVESVEMAPKPGEEAAAAAQAGEEKGPQYAVEARFLRLPKTGLAQVLSAPQWVNEVFFEARSPEDARVYRVADAEQVYKALEGIEGTMLVSAPRCTFIPGKTPPKVLWRRDENRNPGPGDAPLRTLDALSPSFAQFRAQTPPCVVMGDLKTQPVSGEGGQAPLHEGVVFALAAGAAEPPAPLDVTVYLNELRRGTAPKVRDRPVTLRMPLAAGDAIAVVSDTEEPETLQLVLLTLSAVEIPEEIVR